MARGGKPLCNVPLGHIATIELPESRGAIEGANDGEPSWRGPGFLAMETGSGRDADVIIGDGEAASVTAGDTCCSFDEISAARGGLGRFPGREVAQLLWGFAATEPLLLLLSSSGDG